jgi:hypothetical protein
MVAKPDAYGPEYRGMVQTLEALVAWLRENPAYASAEDVQTCERVLELMRRIRSDLNPAKRIPTR